jgi:hypothetical protein
MKQKKHQNVCFRISNPDFGHYFVLRVTFDKKQDCAVSKISCKQDPHIVGIVMRGGNLARLRDHLKGIQVDNQLLLKYWGNQTPYKLKKLRLWDFPGLRIRMNNYIKS